MSRLATTPPETWPEALWQAAGARSTAVELGITMITAQRPELALALAEYSRALRTFRTLPERLMELVRLRIAFHNQCRSCMAIRYEAAVQDGLDEGAVCSLDNPYAAPDLTQAEKAAIDYGERLATNHLSIDDAAYDRLREHFTEPQIVELGLWCALCVGIGRLSATWDLVEHLPEAFQDKTALVTPASGDPVVVSRR